MSARSRPSHRSGAAEVIVALVALVVLIAGCGPSTTPPPSGSEAPGDSGTSATAPATAGGSAPPVELVVGLGYIPSVQFAPFYLAQQQGYYEEAGLIVEFQNRIDPDLITLVGQGTIDIGLGDGTSVIPAVSQGIPVRYMATIYGKFPSVVFAKRSAGIDSAADLAGKRLGTPGRFGSSWVMVQALLQSAGLSEEDLEIVEYPDFGQGAAVAAGAVDAATGFANNEPVQLELSGSPASLLRVDDIVPLPGPGLIAGVETLEEQPEAVQAFVVATLRAMEEISADPEVGLDAAIEAVPELRTDRDTQAAILTATVDAWKGTLQAERGLGAVDRDGWQRSIAFLADQGLVPNPITVEDVLRDDLLPPGD